MLNRAIYKNDNWDNVINLLKQREAVADNSIVDSVAKIIEKVKKNGDLALVEYTNEFDNVILNNFLVTDQEINEAFKKVDDRFIEILKLSKENIEFYHEGQVKDGYLKTKDKGIFLGQRVLALEKVGVYVPGGTAAYPSSVLMNVIPAKVAGVKEVVMVTPPGKDGGINPYIAVAAKIAGVDKIYKIGGAQAIAALAYGTETITKVDKIVGPGNIYVATAKKLVYGIVDIDMIAGPSEILIVADQKANEKYIAADLMSQAEHDVLAAAILVTTSSSLCDNVEIQLKEQLKSLSRKNIIEQSLNNYGTAIICNSIDECIEVSNLIAPEHLELMIENPMEKLNKVKNAGSIFLGYNCPEAVGDYFAGTNHVLPTNGTARFFSPLSVDDFTKKSSYLYYSNDALNKYGKDIMYFANKEGLTAHENSVKVRLQNENNS